MKSRVLPMAVVLGLITAVGPFAIDMYLPAMPTMGASLGAGPAAVQMSLTAFFITIGVCQLIYGPLSDILGRKTPIYGGLCIFVLGSVGCAFAPNIQVLIGFRVLQALGACAGMVIPRAIVRDLYTGHEATKLMSLLMLVVSISPILAPLTGSFVIAALSWRWVFGVLTLAAGVAMALAITQLHETRPREARVHSSWGSAFGAYLILLGDPAFMGLTLVAGFGIGAFFVYIGNASFVLIDHYGLTPTQFSLCFALNAASFFACSQMTGLLTRRFGLPPVVRVAVSGFALAMSVAAVLALAGVTSLPVMILLLFLGYGCLGLVLPTTAVLSLEHHGAIAGTASALLGSIQMVTGAAIMAVVGLFADGTLKPMIVGIAGCALGAFLMAQMVLRKGRA